MNQEARSTLYNALVTFFSGAIVGAVTVAFTTGKTGRQRRRDIERLGTRIRCRYCHSSLDDCAENVLEGAADSACGATGRLSEAWEDTKDSAAKVGSDVKHAAEKIKKDLTS